MPSDGSALLTQVYAGAKHESTTPEYSPDGQWIIFTRNFTKSWDIVGRRTNGDATVRALVAEPATQQSSPTISPDGRWLAYQSDESGRFEVYVCPFPNTKSAKRQMSASGGSAPRWSADGRELFFVDARLDMIAVPVTLSPTFAAGAPVRLFSTFSDDMLTPGYQFDVSRDGRRFLMSRRRGGSSARPDELVVVQNVFAELKAKVH